MAPLKFGKKKKFYYTHFSFIILYNYNGCINKHILKGKKENVHISNNIYNWCIDIHIF